MDIKWVDLGRPCTYFSFEAGSLFAFHGSTWVERESTLGRHGEWVGLPSDLEL